MKKTLDIENKIGSKPDDNPRSRILYFLMTMLVISSGLFSRKIAYQLPELVNLYLGDALWALMIFLITGFIFKWISTLQVAIFAVSFCYLIEISQLYHADWIDNIRYTRLGGLILGFGFLWSDILAYSIGVGFGVILEKFILKR
ncbi:DUF2809 domain-containing protein [Dyadobacter sp. CY356]|uniref:ribosomal maturation YjgA family protein n=1 Tax=Dyadobacter sp. CY356 TaxID=2906442 RepID=UPI001F1B55A1|nr:DUF2809 domain-containing protein [Dyadobacter sp. CY356]MCF0058117.1 DUF2809 domain-containing protein [Dyadobacter sp. CY356]